MRKFRMRWCIGLTLAVGAAFLISTGCGGGGGDQSGGSGGEPKDTPTPVEPEKTIPGIRSELVVGAADGVTAMAFAPDGRLFLTEQNTGDVRIVTPRDELLPEPFVHIDLPAARESTLQGIAIDPEFEENGYVYVYATRAAGSEQRGTPVLMRFTDVDNTGTDPTELMTFSLADADTPVAIGGRIHFGPDGYLYLTIGDSRDVSSEQFAQDLSSPFGKVLRVSRDGQPAPDNPFLDEPGADPRVYAYGLRNARDFAFHPDSGSIYAPDRAAPCDELNVIEAGSFHSWPRSLDVSDKPCPNPGGAEPIYFFSLPRTKPGDRATRVSPTGIEFVSGEVYPAIGDGLLVCEFQTAFMRRLDLSGPNEDAIVDDSVVVQDCTTALAANPEGVIYYSNRKDIRRLPPQ